MVGKRAVRFVVPEVTPAEIERSARDRRRGPGSARLRVSGERIRLEVPATRTPTPVLKATLTPADGGTLVEGHVHFGWINVFNALYVVVAALLTGVAGLVAAEGGGAVIAVLIALVGVGIWVAAVRVIMATTRTVDAEAERLQHRLLDEVGTDPWSSFRR
ncbi:hypothetical protein JK386_17865 [Nocardioides sp. zg-536]|uniref:Uncharacterized protein n=1 Tax=Nocardioides faecalis TaxID=2803858 RepID=A0A938Y3X6_9ACTN|nr:hypothetical protein [Nocardioides faecalis]MBM9461762.1 hypothetical protein [Nocardioides faecalis]QVI58961.1 hypothetical protein KG111_00735 [Nocardioides faecalis]